MKRILLGLVAVMAVIWSFEYARARNLRQQLEARRNQVAELASLRARQQELKTHDVGDEKLAELRHAAKVSATAQTETALAEVPPSANQAVNVGEWTTAQTWKNAGHATPEATLETALFAAVGGDLTLFGGLLELPEDIRKKIDVARAGMPEEWRKLYPTPESLVAALAVRNIPVGNAQLVWSQPETNDMAAMCVFLRSPSTPPGSADLSTPTTTDGAKNVSPPELPRIYETKAVALTLHKNSDGWKFVVPQEVIGRLQDLGLKL